MAHLPAIGSALVLAFGPLTCLEGVPDDPVSKRTRAVWVRDCSQCHGVTGAADGERVSNLGVRVPDFRDPCRKITDEWIEKVILSGGASYGGSEQMRPHHELEYDKEVLAQLVALVQTLREPGHCEGPATADPPIEVPP